MLPMKLPEKLVTQTNSQQNALVLANAHSQKFGQTRRDLIDKLKLVPGFASALGNLKSQNLYKVVLGPGEELYKDAKGQLFATLRGPDGKIIKHAPLEKLGPSCMKFAKAMGAQVLLISISIQLGEIQLSVEEVIKSLNKDRIGEIVAGRNLLYQARLVSDPELCREIIRQALTPLNMGIAKTLLALRDHIAAMPEPKTGFFDGWGMSCGLEKANMRFDLVCESLAAVLAGAAWLAECYAALNEPNAASYAVETIISDIAGAGIEDARRKARLVPNRNRSCLPEKGIEHFISKSSLMMEQARNLAPAALQNRVYEIPFRPIEIAAI